MIFKKFIIKELLVLLFVVLSIVGINYWWDPYGIWHDVSGKDIRMIESARTTKYLMGFNYIPSNFNGLLIGPSLSANMNTKKIKNYKLYNVSFNGANITELDTVVRNILEHDKKRNIKFVVFCINTYMTKNYGEKSTALDPKHFLGTLGSINMLELLYNKYRIKLNPKWDKFHDSSYGFIDNDKHEKSLDSKEMLFQKLKKMKNGEDKLIVNSKAMKEFEELVKYIRSKKIKIFAYVYPRQYDMYKLWEKEYNDIYEVQKSFFTKDDVVFDFNDKKFESFRKDYNSYIDGSHLSHKGADVVLREIEKRLDQYYIKRSNYEK